MRTLLIVLLGLGCTSALAEEQETKWRFHSYLGGARFTESEWHLVPGIGLGYQVSPRLGAIGELSYLYASDDDQDVELAAKFFYGLRNRDHGAVPYVTFGVGVLWNRTLLGYGPDGPPELRPYWSSELWAGGGAGVRVPVTGSLWLAPEVQAAWPLVLQVGVRVGLGW